MWPRLFWLGRGLTEDIGPTRRKGGSVTGQSRPCQIPLMDAIILPKHQWNVKLNAARLGERGGRRAVKLSIDLCWDFHIS